MKVGFFGPMPPARTGVADYSVNLLRALRQFGSVELNSGSVNLYHLGNNALHREIYIRALQEPGIAVLHDAVLHHFLLGSLNREQYIEEFRYNYGDWTSILASDLWARRGLSASDEQYFEYPMLRRICEVSRAVIVHNPAAAKAVRAHTANPRIFEIPHLYTPELPASEADIAAVRRDLGSDARKPICGVFGYLRESKRLRIVIEACGAAGLALLVAGACPNDLAKSLAPWLRLPWVVRRPFANAETFRLLRNAIDVCINLRYPSAGETSGITISQMGAGKTVLMSHSEENSRYPEDSCLRVETGISERDHLTDLLVWLREFPASASEIGLRAAAWIRREHKAERVAELYWNAIRTVG